MISERQRIEAAPTVSPAVDSVPPPPSYEEANDVPTSPAQNGSTDAMGYFLGEVSKQLSAKPFSRKYVVLLKIFIFSAYFDRLCTLIKLNPMWSLICQLETLL